MDFALDKKYEMAQNLFREFAQNEVKPLAQEIDERAACQWVQLACRCFW